MAAALNGYRVLVSGAGVAGPALAWWLAHYGAEVTVVEKARALRESGFAVDFRGPTHLGVLARMGVLDELRAVQTHGNAMCSVDEQGREIFTLPAEFTGGELEVYRRDLSRVFYEHSRGSCRYLFGDEIVELTDAPDGVRVSFAGGDTQRYDLVVGADGLHSAVRRFAFGPESRFVRHLGYHIAGWELPNDLGADRTSRQYNQPGRMASVAADLRVADTAGVMAVFRSGPASVGWHDRDAQKAFVTSALDGMGWHVPRLLAGLADADELYFDAIARVHAPHWTAGRVALLGDAAWGVTLGGMGVGTGVVGAYVLAGELAAARGAHVPALAAYEQRMRRFAGRWQRGAQPGRFLAPATRYGLALRNGMFANRVVRKMMLSGTRSLATDAGLPDYAPASIG
jgi:2-polyprenyl-6-methoxyphenol hydroxylase-like FAD-dependent oxidoreductase